MIKVEHKGRVYTFEDGTTIEDQQEAIAKHLEKNRFFRPIVMRKSNGDSVHLGNGVRKHGKRHTS